LLQQLVQQLGWLLLAACLAASQGLLLLAVLLLAWWQSLLGLLSWRLVLLLPRVPGLSWAAAPAAGRAACCHTASSTWPQ
jgi:hypothetical protein